MISKFLTSTAIGLALVLASSSPALSKKGDESKAEMEAMMAKAKELGSPGAGHEVLKPLEGDWTIETKGWMPGEKKPMVSTGSGSMNWVMGGRWLKQDFKGTWMGQPFEGLGYIGYDNVKKQYVSVWMDNMSTGLMKSSGQYDAAAKTIKDQGDFSCPMANKEMSFRDEWKILDNDNLVYSMYGNDPEGKEMKMMEIKYKRAKSASR